MDIQVYNMHIHINTPKGLQTLDILYHPFPEHLISVLPLLLNKKQKKKNASIDKNSGSYECLHVMLFVHYVCIHAKRKQNFQNIIPSSIRVNLGSVNC